MATWLMILLAIHAVPGVFWAGSTFVLARQPLGGSDLTLGQAQAGAAGVTILAGLALWAMNHAYAPGPGEWTLAVGAVCAVIAAVVQQGVAWPARRRLAGTAGGQSEAPADRRRAEIGQRVAALLLAITVIAMVTWRYV